MLQFVDKPINTRNIATKAVRDIMNVETEKIKGTFLAVNLKCCEIYMGRPKTTVVLTILVSVEIIVNLIV